MRAARLPLGAALRLRLWSASSSGGLRGAAFGFAAFGVCRPAFVGGRPRRAAAPGPCPPRAGAALRPRGLWPVPRLRARLGAAARRGRPPPGGGRGAPPPCSRGHLSRAGVLLAVCAGRGVALPGLRPGGSPAVGGPGVWWGAWRLRGGPSVRPAPWRLWPPRPPFRPLACRLGRFLLALSRVRPWPAAPSVSAGRKGRRPWGLRP